MPVDVLAIAVVQVKMLNELAGVYNVAFQEDRAKTILISLATGIGAPVVGAAIGVSAVKFVPVAGYFIGAAAVPGVAAAFTYAVGKVFHQHFASGGTFLNFDPKKVRTYFARQFQEGKSVAAKIKSDSPQEVETPVKSA